MANGKQTMPTPPPNPMLQRRDGGGAPSIEDEMARTVATDKRLPVGSVEAMGKIEKLLSNAITAAHDDAGKALDKVLSEARELMGRIEEGVEGHKRMLQKEGQVIASQLEAAVQELKRTVQWVEQQGPRLRNPQTTEGD